MSRIDYFRHNQGRGTIMLPNRELDAKYLDLINDPDVIILRVLR